MELILMDASVSNKTFVYPQLPSSSEVAYRNTEDIAFRLLRLHPAAQEGSRGDDICCDLNTEKLSRPCKSYIALSYAWGQPGISHQIWVNDYPFNVHANLYSFLKCYRAHLSKPVSLWVDAICIDQSRNDEERNGQVGIMGEIYRGAASVISWLGPLDDLLDLPIPTGHNGNAGDWHSFLRYLRGAIAASPSERVKKGLDEVAHNIAHYFSRMWICQELALARMVDFYCGSHRLSRNDLWRLLELVDECCPAKLSWKSTIRAALRSLELVMEGCPSICQLISAFKQRECAESHDRIYALRGMIGETALETTTFVPSPSLVPVDYGQPFLHTMLSAINTSHTQAANSIQVGQQMYADLLDHVPAGPDPEWHKPPLVVIQLEGGFMSQISGMPEDASGDLREPWRSTWKIVQHGGLATGQVLMPNEALHPNNASYQQMAVFKLQTRGLDSAIALCVQPGDIVLQTIQVDRIMVGVSLNEDQRFWNRAREACQDVCETQAAVVQMLQSSVVRVHLKQIWEKWERTLSNRNVRLVMSIEVDGTAFLQLLKTLHLVEPPETWKYLDPIHLSCAARGV